MELKPQRGDILDRNYRKLALDHSVYSVFAAPRKISADRKDSVAQALSKVLGLDKGLVLSRIEKDKAFVWIKRELDKDLSDAVEALNIDGVELLKEYKRFYPKGSLASHIIGFAGLDDTGLEGVELEYDSYLKGSPGWRWTVRDAKRRNIFSGDVKSIPPSEGLNVILTIDETIQHIAERELEKVFEKYRAKSASIIIMDPHTGEILALANRPTFDLNDFSRSTKDQMRNRAVTDLYEPGSVFKIVTASCAIENRAVELDQEFFCENGKYRVGGRILHDHKPYATLTFREIFEKSSNIGVTKVAEVLGRDEIYKFSRLFGFGDLTGIDLPGEAVGILRPPREWSAVSISAVPIGQEVGVTSIQLVTAVSAIANGGRLLRPHIVKEIRNANGDLIKAFSLQESKRVLSRESAKIIRDILKGVVENGTGRNAKADSYTTAGKTGTAQKIESGGGYSHSKFVASFLGFAPAESPKIAIIVSLDEPRPVYYGGLVSAPVFRNVAVDVLRYLNVPADKAKEETRI
ncbi:MAG: penicillin-binding transpeptidase domain-containing protein [Candidatus Omnitrophota bacterium]